MKFTVEITGEQIKKLLTSPTTKETALGYTSKPKELGA